MVSLFRLYIGASVMLTLWVVLHAWVSNVYLYRTLAFLSSNQLCLRTIVHALLWLCYGLAEFARRVFVRNKHPGEAVSFVDEARFAAIEAAMAAIIHSGEFSMRVCLHMAVVLACKYLRAAVATRIEYQNVDDEAAARPGDRARIYVLCLGLVVANMFAVRRAAASVAWGQVAAAPSRVGGFGARAEVFPVYFMFEHTCLCAGFLHCAALMTAADRARARGVRRPS